MTEPAGWSPADEEPVPYLLTAPALVLLAPTPRERYDVLTAALADAAGAARVARIGARTTCPVCCGEHYGDTPVCGRCSPVVDVADARAVAS